MTEVSKEKYLMACKDGLVTVHQIKFWTEEEHVGMFYPVISNGQILYGEDLRKCLNYAKRHGVMEETIKLLNEELKA